MKFAKTLILAVLLAVGVACSYSAKKTTPAMNGTMPTINALVPNNVNSGTTGNSFMVTGANFNSNAVVNWNGKALTTMFVSRTQVTATIPDANVATAGTAAVTVTNPGTPGGIYGGGTLPETSNSMTLTIN